MQQWGSKFTKFLLPIYLPALLLGIYEFIMQKPAWYFRLILYSGAFMNQLVTVLAVHFFKPKAAFQVCAVSFSILCSIPVIVGWGYDFEKHNDDPEMKKFMMQRYLGFQTMMSLFYYAQCLNVVPFYKFKHSFPIMFIPFLIQYFTSKEPQFLGQSLGIFNTVGAVLVGNLMAYVL